jgi:membrane-bound lytic murein transglycosylase D
VKNIVSNPQMYGLALPDIPNHPYFVTVTTARDIDVTMAAKLAGMSVEEFRSLNPSFAKPVILGATNPQILLPFDNATSFQRNLSSYSGALSSWTTYTVTERARPAAIADKIGVDADTLMSVNRIPAGMRLKPGSTIVVPRTDDDDEDISADVAANAMLAIERDVPDTRKLVIRVRRKQSIGTLADRYNVSPAQLRAWNRTHGEMFMPGQVVVLHVPYGRSVPAEPGPVRVETVAASSRSSGGVSRIGTRAPEPKSSRGGKTTAHSSGKVTKVSASTASNAAKPAASAKTTKPAAASKSSKKK